MFKRKILEQLIYDKKNEYKNQGRAITRKDISDEIGIPLSTLDVILNESKQIDPRSSTVEKIADYFGVSIDYLFGRSSMMKNDIVSEEIENYGNEPLLKKIYAYQEEVLKLTKELCKKNGLTI
jgi:transcriptional regulator with XRE-family HTH domain